MRLNRESWETAGYFALVAWLTALVFMLGVEMERREALKRPPVVQIVERCGWTTGMGSGCSRERPTMDYLWKKWDAGASTWSSMQDTTQTATDTDTVTLLYGNDQHVAPMVLILPKPPPPPAELIRCQPTEGMIQLKLKSKWRVIQWLDKWVLGCE